MAKLYLSCKQLEVFGRGEERQRNGGYLIFAWDYALLENVGSKILILRNKVEGNEILKLFMQALVTL